VWGELGEGLVEIGTKNQANKSREIIEREIVSAPESQASELRQECLGFLVVTISECQGHEASW
jgi:hypothetical protein